MPERYRGQPVIIDFGPSPLRAGATAQHAVITLQRALSEQATPERLRAVADWNERETHNQRRRKARARHKAQAAALRAVAAQMEAGQMARAA